MTMGISRRSLLTGALGLGAVASVGLPARSARAASALKLTATTRVIEVKGRAARVFGLTGPDGRSGLMLAPGERFAVSLANQTRGPTIVHWHGQLPHWTEDGFPWPETPPIAAGAAGAYDFAPIPGTFWMHSHQDMQEQALMTAPLIVRSAADLADDRQEVVLMLHDFSFRPPEELLAGLLKAKPGQAMAGMDMSAMSGMGMGGMKMPMPASGSGMAMDLNDIDYDAFLANDRTFDDPEVVRAERGGRLRLRIINGASATQFWIDLGGLQGQVVAVDGHPVLPVATARFPVALAQRVDVLIDLPGPGTFPVFAQVEGLGARTGIVVATPGAAVNRLAGVATEPAPAVDLSLERHLSALAPLAPLAPRRPDIVHTVTLDGSMSPYAWTMNGESWPKGAPLKVEKGQRVAIDFVNRSMMAHPMHLHGHAFQVVALDDAPMSGAVRDTVLVPAMGRMRVVFDADNPGRWALHCHNLYHMMAGMMTELRYPGIV
jgi:FtsP/CotA-like multicopper oxidase with cupredoxin domain